MLALLIACGFSLGLSGKCPSDLSNWADYIVVGAGTAGSVVASRLSEGTENVLVIEEGHDYDYKRSEINQPRWIYNLWDDPELRYLIPAIKGKDDLLDDRRAGYRGRGPGGTSNINGALWSRPPLSEYDAWNIPGWSGNEILPFFYKIESWEGATVDGFHGVNGKVRITTSEVQKYARAWQKDARTYGARISEDGNTTETLTLLKRAIKNGVRQDAYTAYVHPVEASRPNLCVLTESFVTTLEFDSTDKTKVTGVRYVNPPNWQISKVVTAKREIILSAGVYGTSKILLLSGIGPQKDLQQLGIQVRKDLPVGQDFTSRITSFAIMSGNGLVRPSVTADYMYPDILDPTSARGAKALAEWKTTGTGGLVIGPASILGTQEAGSYMIQFSDCVPSQYPPGYLQHCPPFAAGNSAFNAEDGLGPMAGVNMGVCVLGFPKSKSTITLKSSKPSDEINYYPNYLDDPADTAELMHCLRELRGNTGADPNPPPPWSGIYGPSLQVLYSWGTDFTPYRGTEVYPGWQADLPSYIKRCSSSAYHVFSTTKLGKVPGDGSVVDPQLLVHGFTNLRIADAGVLLPISSGPMSSTYMIGERAADFIKTTWHVGV